jgi:hypothetical protein
MRVLRSSEKKERLRHLPVLLLGFILVLSAPAIAQVLPTAPTPAPIASATFGASPSPQASATPKPVLVRLRADHITFYYDRYLVEADGHVRVQTSSGETITGDTFSMDLKLDRFLVASHVHLTSPGGNVDGAAIAYFLSFRRVYLVPVISKPDRWTYLDGDYLHPLRGRQMPGDVFYFPDLSHEDVSLTAHSAVISSTQYVRFGDATMYVTPGVSIPLPSFYVYFGLNRNLAQNSLSGASYDATWNVTGNANAITAAHVRWDNANDLYASFEQHYVSDNAYAVLSDNPATKRIHFWNLVGGDNIGSHFQINVFSQLEEDQTFFEEPASASLVNYVSATQAFRQSSLNAFATLVNYNLTNEPLFDHTSALQLTWSTFNHRIGKTPFYEAVRYGFGFNHDPYNIGYPPYYPNEGLQLYNGVPYFTIWNHLVGYTFYLPGFKFGDRDNVYRTYYFNATTDTQRQWMSLPHHINTTTTTLSLSRTFSRFVNSYVSFNVQNTSDIYNEGGYAVPEAPNDIDGQPDLNLLAFRGAATLRTGTLSTTYSASPNLVTIITYAHHHDFPLAVPGVFSPPPLNNLGQYLYTSWLGEPPDQLTAEVRARLLPHLVVDVQRTDYFNFGTLKWSPQFIVQFSQ